MYEPTTIMEESKENSSDSSDNCLLKDKIIREIHLHSLAVILKERLRPELYQIFFNKYSVSTFE